MSDCNFNNIRACVFDAYGTLFDVHTAVGGLRERVGPAYAELSILWRSKQLEYTWLRSLMRAHVDFWELTSDALRHAMAAANMEDDALHAELMQAYLSLDAFTEVRATLGLLQQAGIPTAILTNGSPMMIEAAVNSAGLADLVDHQFSIESVGIYKPDPAVYRFAADELGLEPAQISFQSSNAWDAAGAAHFGFQVAWINRYAQVPENLPGKPDAVLPDLAGLPTLLGVC